MRHIHQLVATTLIMLLTACGGGGGGGGGGSDGAITYTVGGSVTGLSGAVVLKNNGSNSLTLDTDGAFTFSSALSDGAGYNVSVATQPTGQQCLVTGGNGIISGSKVTNVGVTCQCSDGTDSCYATPPGGDPGGTAGAQYSFTVSVGEISVAGTREVTVAVSGASGLSSAELARLCVDGFTYRTFLPNAKRIYTRSPTYCLSEATLVGDDYVKTLLVPYGTYGVSLAEVYYTQSRYYIRTLDAPVFQTVEVRGPAVQNIFSTILPNNFNKYVNVKYLTDTDLTVFWRDPINTSDSTRYGYHLNRSTGQVTNFSMAELLPYGKYQPYKQGLYASFPGDYDVSLDASYILVEHYDIPSDTVSYNSFKVRPECTRFVYTDDVTEGHTVRIGAELRGVYSCIAGPVSPATDYEHTVVLWRYDLDNGSLISQEVIYQVRDTDSSNRISPSTNLNIWPGNYNSEIINYYIELPGNLLFDMRAMAYDGCYDPVRNSLITTTDPDTGANRCLIVDTAVYKLCVESPMLDGTCDADLDHVNYGLRTGLMTQNGDTLLSDGSVFLNGTVGMISRYDYVYDSSYGGLDRNISYDSSASVRNVFDTWGDPLMRYAYGSTWWGYEAMSERGENGELLTQYKDATGRYFLSVSGIQEDVAPPGVIPTGEVDANNNRYYTLSNPDYTVESSCAVTDGSCNVVSDSSRFLLNQKHLASASTEEGSVLIVRGPDYDTGKREVAVGSSSFGSKKFDPATLLLGVWTLQGLTSGTVTISFNADGTGVSDINVPGYLVEKRAYTYAVSGTNITFHYVSEPTPEPNSTIVSINATDLTLKHPVTGTGYYKKL